MHSFLCHLLQFIRPTTAWPWWLYITLALSAPFTALQTNTAHSCFLVVHMWRHRKHLSLHIRTLRWNSERNTRTFDKIISEQWSTKKTPLVKTCNCNLNRDVNHWGSWDTSLENFNGSRILYCVLFANAQDFAISLQMPSFRTTAHKSLRSCLSSWNCFICTSSVASSFKIEYWNLSSRQQLYF